MSIVCVVCVLYEGAIPCFPLNGAEEGKLQPGLYAHACEQMLRLLFLWRMALS